MELGRPQDGFWVNKARLLCLCLPRSPRELEEDLYYQCDSADDAIYGNDPNFSLAMLSEDGEDPYIIPDTL